MAVDSPRGWLDCGRHRVGGYSYDVRLRRFGRVGNRGTCGRMRRLLVDRLHRGDTLLKIEA